MRIKIGVAAAALVFACSGGGNGGTGGGSGGGSHAAGGGSSGGSAGGGTGGAVAGGSGGASGGTGGGTAGSGGGTGGAAGGQFDAGSLPLAQVCDAYIDAICTYYQRCGYVETKAGCIGITNGKFNPWFSRTCLQDEKASIAAGRAAYDDRAGAACVHDLHDVLQCNQNANTYAPECASIITGRVANGAPCETGYECDSNSYCDSSFAMCPGHCLLKKAPGADAGSDQECPSGYYVYDGVCRLYALTNLSCAPLRSGDPLQQCRPGEANCDPGTMTCKPPGQANDPCMADGDCAFPFRCNNMHCSLGSGVGQVCGYGFLGGPQQSCKIDLACDNPLRLDGGSCRFAGSAGASCFSFIECQGNLMCPGIGFAIATDGGIVIDAGTCTPPPGLGGTCDTGNAGCDMMTAYCRTDAGAPHCAPRYDAGVQGPCSADDECTPLDTCAGNVCRRATCVLP